MKPFRVWTLEEYVDRPLIHTERWKRLFITRHFGGAYLKLGMSMSDFEHAGDNVWVAWDGRLRVRVLDDDTGRSRRVAEILIHDYKFADDDPPAA